MGSRSSSSVLAKNGGGGEDGGEFISPAGVCVLKNGKGGILNEKGEILDKYVPETRARNRNCHNVQ